MGDEYREPPEKGEREEVKYRPRVQPRKYTFRDRLDDCGHCMKNALFVTNLVIFVRILHMGFLIAINKHYRAIIRSKR